MKLRTFSILTVIVLTSCSQASTPTPMPSPNVAQQPTVFSTTATLSVSTPTPFPQARLIRSATLLVGPEEYGFNSIAKLSAGTAVNVLGTYVDYARVQAAANGTMQTGFIPRSTLDSLPAGVAELAVDEVPWLRDSLLDRLAYGNNGNTPDPSGAIVLNGGPTGLSDLILKIEPTSGFRLTLQIDAGDGQAGSIFLANKQLSLVDLFSNASFVSLVVSKGGLFYSIRESVSKETMIQLPVGVSTEETVTIVSPNPHGQEILITGSDGSIIQRVTSTTLPGLSNGLFPEGKVYLYFNIPANTQLTIRAFEMEVAPVGILSSKSTYPLFTLRQVADSQGIGLGTEFRLDQTSDSRFTDALFANYNTLVIGTSWKAMWLGPDTYDLGYLDQSVNWALAHNFRVRLLLLFGIDPDVPDWILNGSYSRTELLQILQEHVERIVSHFKGRVAEWIVVNEFNGRAAGFGTDYWNSRMGPEYVEVAFRAAHEADPDAILILNDANNESPRDSMTRAVTDRMLTTVRQMKAKNIPVDAVGMEMHLLMYPWSSSRRPEKEDVIATMQKFGELGVRVYITEFDVDLQFVPGTQEERLAYQAQLYRDMLEACLESGVCDSFSTWGVADAVSWISQCAGSDCLHHPDAAPLMLDEKYDPKPAYFAVYDALTRFTAP